MFLTFYKNARVPSRRLLTASGVNLLFLARAPAGCGRLGWEVTKALVHPMRSEHELMVFTKLPDQLKADWKPILSVRKRQMYARQAQQSPASAKKRIAGTLQSDGRFTKRARRQQHVAVSEKQTGLLTREGSGLEVVGVLGAADRHALGQQGLQWPA